MGGDSPRGGGGTPSSSSDSKTPDSGGLDALFSLEQVAYEPPASGRSGDSLEFPPLTSGGTAPVPSEPVEIAPLQAIDMDLFEPSEDTSSRGSQGSVDEVLDLDTGAVTAAFEAVPAAPPPVTDEAPEPPPAPAAEIPAITDEMAALDDTGISMSWTDTFDVDELDADGAMVVDDVNLADGHRTWDDFETGDDAEDTLDELAREDPSDDDFSSEDSYDRMSGDDSLFDDDVPDGDAGDSLDWGESADERAGVVGGESLAPVPPELRAPPSPDPDSDDESGSFHMEDEDPSVDTETATLAAPFELEAIEEGSADEDSMGDIVQRGIEALHGGDRGLAMDLFERALRRDPDDGVARTYLDVAHDLVIQEHLPGAGLKSVPRLRVGREMLMILELDPQAGGVLAMVDGLATVEELETMLPYLDRQTIYRHLATALTDGLIDFSE